MNKERYRNRMCKQTLVWWMFMMRSIQVETGEPCVRMATTSRGNVGDYRSLLQAIKSMSIQKNWAAAKLTFLICTQMDLLGPRGVFRQCAGYTGYVANQRMCSSAMSSNCCPLISAVNQHPDQAILMSYSKTNLQI